MVIKIICHPGGLSFFFTLTSYNLFAQYSE